MSEAGRAAVQLWLRLIDQVNLELAALGSAVPCARGHVRSVALEWDLPGLADTAELTRPSCWPPSS